MKNIFLALIACRLIKIRRRLEEIWCLHLLQRPWTCHTLQDPVQDGGTCSDTIISVHYVHPVYLCDFGLTSPEVRSFIQKHFQRLFSLSKPSFPAFRDTLTGAKVTTGDFCLENIDEKYVDAPADFRVLFRPEN